MFIWNPTSRRFDALKGTQAYTSDNFAYQILCKASRISRYLRYVGCAALIICNSVLLWSTIRTPEFLPYLCRSKGADAMGLSPLRKIVTSSLEVFSQHNGIPHSFVIKQTLECSHIHTLFSLSVDDLVNAYCDSELRSKRRRCHKCAQLLQKKRHSMSVYDDSLPVIKVIS